MITNADNPETIELVPSVALMPMERYQHYYDFAPVAFLIINHQGLIVEANYRIGALLGIPRGELVGRDFTDFFLQSQASALTEYLHEICRQGCSREFNAKIESGISGIIPVKLTASSLFKESKGSYQFLISVVPVESDLPVSKSMHFQSQIMDYLAAGVCIIRLEDRNIIYSNQEFESMFGYERDELLGQSVDVVILPRKGYPLELREELGREIRLKGQWTGEIQGRRKDQSVFWCKVHTSHCDHPEFGPVWIAVHEDITEAREVSDELVKHRSNLQGMVEERTLELQSLNDQLVKEVEQRKRAEAKYLDLYDNSPDMKVSVDPFTGTILECNETFLKNLGYSREEVIARSIFEFYDPTCVQIAREALENFLDQEVLHGVTLKLRRKNGTQLDVSLDANAVYDSHEHLLYCRSSYHDITDRARIEKLQVAKEVAEKSDRLKSKFLAAMSHEVRTPLNSIIGLTEILLESSMDLEQQERLSTVLKSGNNLLKILNDILDFSKIEAGYVDIQAHPFCINLALQDVLNLFEEQALKKGIRLESKGLDLGDLWLNGDSGRIVQVVTNLLSNAIKFTEHGYVSMHLDLVERSATEQRFKISILDSGIGIPDSASGEIFKAFTQAHGNLSRSLGGTGLGLAISSQLVRLMGGKIYHGKNKPSGSIFYLELTLPTIEESIEIQTKNQSVPMEVTGQNWAAEPRVLLVEDDPANQEVGRLMLRNLGCLTDIAGNGDEAQKFLEAHQYDMVLMDCQLPKQDGLALTRDIRKQKDNRNYKVPILALTAHAMKGERERCIEAGMNDFMTKPIRLANLKKAIQTWVYENPVKPYRGAKVTNSSTSTLLKKGPSRVLKGFSGLDADVITRIQKVYIEESIPKYLTLVEKSLKEKNPNELRRALHSLRYNFSIFHEESGIDLLDRIKELVLADQFEPASKLYGNVEQIAIELKEKWFGIQSA